MSAFRPAAGAAAAGIAGLLATDESDAGLLYTASKTAAREATEKFAKNNPGFRPPVVARIAPNQYMTDAAGKPIPGKHGRKYMGKGKGTEYLPVATDPAARNAEIDASYQGLLGELDRIGTGKDDWRKRRGALNEFMHTQNDYERWSPIVRDTYDGGRNAGDAWKMGMDAKYEEIMERVPRQYHNDVRSYFMDHIIKRDTARNPHPRFDPNKRQPKMDPLPVGAAAAAGAGGANAQGNGFAPWPEPKSTLTNPVTQGGQDMLMGNPMGAMGGDFSGGLDGLLTVLDGPMQAMQSGSRLLYGLLAGEGWDGATDNADKVIQQGVDQTQEQFGDFITDKTGDDTLGFYAKWLPYFASPI